jgi:hypothetical protein
MIKKITENKLEILRVLLYLFIISTIFLTLNYLL